MFRCSSTSSPMQRTFKSMHREEAHSPCTWQTRVTHLKGAAVAGVVDPHVDAAQVVLGQARQPCNAGWAAHVHVKACNRHTQAGVRQNLFTLCPQAIALYEYENAMLSSAVVLQARHMGSNTWEMAPLTEIPASISFCSSRTVVRTP